MEFLQYFQRHHDRSPVESNPGPFYQAHIFAAYLSEKVFESIVVCFHEIFPTKVGLCFGESKCMIIIDFF
jgi:hypothetical protein